MTKTTILETINLPRKPKPAEAKRIEMIVKLNNRRAHALAAGNEPELLRVADEYARKGMPRMAAQVRQSARVRA